MYPWMHPPPPPQIAEHVPAVFVGSLGQLFKDVDTWATAMEQLFEGEGRAPPPWPGLDGRPKNPAGGRGGWGEGRHIQPSVYTDGFPSYAFCPCRIDQGPLGGF